MFPTAASAMRFAKLETDQANRLSPDATVMWKTIVI